MRSAIYAGALYLESLLFCAFGFTAHLLLKKKTGLEMFRARDPPPPQPIPLTSEESLLLKMRGLPFGVTEAQIVEFFKNMDIGKIKLNQKIVFFYKK